MKQDYKINIPWRVKSPEYETAQRFRDTAIRAKVEHEEAELKRKAENERARYIPRGFALRTVSRTEVAVSWYLVHREVKYDFREVIQKSCLKNWEDAEALFSRITADWAKQIFAGMSLQDLLMEDQL